MTTGLNSQCHEIFGDDYDRRAANDVICTLMHLVLKHQLHRQLLFCCCSAFNTIHPHMLEKLVNLKVNPFLIYWYHLF